MTDETERLRVLVETLRTNRDQLREKLKQADEVIADLRSARLADAQRMLGAEAAVERVRKRHEEYKPGFCRCANPYPCPTIQALEGRQA